MWNKETLSREWKESIIVPIRKKGDRMDLIIIEDFHSCLPHVTLSEDPSVQQLIAVQRSYSQVCYLFLSLNSIDGVVIAAQCTATFSRSIVLP